jgi:LPXTG-site transpeptidase (sortase) family protein
VPALTLLGLAGIALIAVGTFLLVRGGNSDGSELRKYIAEWQARQSAGGGATAGQPAPQIPPGEGPLRMTVERIGIDAAVDPFGLDAEGLPAVPFNGGQIAWYAFSAWPGTGGNSVFAGHLDWAGKPGVFARLDELTAGDSIVLSTDVWNRHYSVVSVSQLSAADPETLRVFKPTDQEVITLITCGGDWEANEEELFGGQYDRRVIVRATRLPGAEDPFDF